jgi:ATP-dependent DNA ligase
MFGRKAPISTANYAASETMDCQASQTQAASDGERGVRLVYYAFDLLHLGGRDTPLILSRVHWVEPQLVAEITYLTWTADNLLRHTVYVGLREDKPAEQVRRE